MSAQPDLKLIQKREIFPDSLPLTLRPRRIAAAARQARQNKQWLLLFIIGTKPCFYKFWGFIRAAAEMNLPYLIIDSGQHYDPLLTYGQREFGLIDQVAVHLNIRGDLAEKAGELFFKTTWFSRYISRRFDDLVTVPVVLGDTLMTSVFPQAWLLSRHEKAIQLEAGLRSMAPRIMRQLARDRSMTMDTFFEAQRRGGWERLMDEPFPEQFDTITAAAGSRYFFAPTETNRSHLLQEGHPADAIHVIGGTVVDALAVTRNQRPSHSIFQVYPRLGRGQWIRVDIHRKENLTPRRFSAIIGAIRILVHQGYHVNFVEMNVTRKALDQYGLRRSLEVMQKKRNFLLTPIWPEYAQVLEFYQSPHCLAALTDSGGLQEELNMLQKACFTCRFSTDRPESVREGHGNLLVPPIDSKFMAKAVQHALRHPRWWNRLNRAKPLYGSKPGRKFAQIVSQLMRKQRRPSFWAHERLGFWTETRTLPFGL